jgi:hypothetical protein
MMRKSPRGEAAMSAIEAAFRQKPIGKAFGRIDDNAPFGQRARFIEGKLKNVQCAIAPGLFPPAAFIAPTNLLNKHLQ